MSGIMNIIKYDFTVHGDNRGQLVSIEELKDIPFEIKRVYFMYGTLDEVERGHHAHKSIEQVLICVHGSCKIMLDNGKEKEVVSLKKPFEGLYVANDVWRVMYDFKDDAVLLVLASKPYDESDYIRNYNSFLEYLNSKGSERNDRK